MIRILPILLILFLAGCDGADLEQMTNEKLASMELTAQQTEVAKAVIEGYKKELGRSVLRSREVMTAACYAKSVRMPSQYHRVHKLYLADYVTIDENFYPWFQSKGIGDQAAWDIGQNVQKGFEACSMGSLLKKRFGKE